MTKVVLRQKGSSTAGASSPLPPCDAHKGDVCAHHLPALTFMHPLYCRGSGPAQSIRTEHSYKPCGEDRDKLPAKDTAGAPGGAQGRGMAGSLCPGSVLVQLPGSCCSSPCTKVGKQQKPRGGSWWTGDITQSALAQGSARISFLTHFLASKPS